MEKTVIIYSSKYGVCEKVAKQLANNIGCPYQSVMYTQNIDNYDNIILLTSIYKGSGTRHIQRFARINHDLLLTKKVALGCTCYHEDKAFEQLKATYPETLYNHAFFKGSLGSGVDFNKLNFMEKMVFSRFAENENSFYKLNNENMNFLVSTIRK